MAAPYVELHCHSAFSFLDGASSPLELAARAADLGYEAMALTDHDGLWGSMEFATACRGIGIRAITGSELTVSADRSGGSSRHLTILVESAVGYRNLCGLVSEAHAGTREGPDRRAGRPSISLDHLEGRTDGLVCLTGCAGMGLVASTWEEGRLESGRRAALELLEIFGRDHLRVEIQRPFWRNDMARNRWLEAVAAKTGVPTVATGNVHAHLWERSRLQDAMVATSHGLGIVESEHLRRGNTSSCLVSPGEMAHRFRCHPGAVEETVELAGRLTFELDRELGYRYPGAGDPGTDARLRELCTVRFDALYRGTTREGEAASRLTEELGVISRLGLSGFFLLHHDLLELAREVAVEVRGRGSARSVLPPGRGRGSSVSSIVCYLTGLSHVDPVEAGLFPGRFLNDEVTSVPDIDLDFPRDIRAELILRIHERYGTERSALVASFPTYRVKGAVREFGKALGLPSGEIEKVARAAGHGRDPSSLSGDLQKLLGSERASSKGWQSVLDLTGQACGLPRHPSQHPGGMIISTDPLTDVCPVVPASMHGRQIVQWDKDSCQDAGFLKIDLLGLGMLSAVERCVDEIARVRGERVDLSRIDLDDEEVFGAIRRAETTGVFQIESRAQMQLLPRLLPRDLADLAVQIALVRPGPIQGGAVHPYVERRKMLRRDPEYRVPYSHPLVRGPLEETLGVIIFQEQVIEVAMEVAGFTASRAEGLRRAMSRRRSHEAILAHRESFMEGAGARGVEPAVASDVFESILAFSGFGFPKSHSVAFALLAYQSAWLKVHYGPEYLCSLLNEQPMGFYPPDSLVQEARRSGIPVWPPDVNTSMFECTTEWEDSSEHPVRDSADHRYEGPGVRIGLGYIRGLEEESGSTVVREREAGGIFETVPDLASRTGLGRSQMELLAWSGALRSLSGGDDTRALWDAGVATAGGAATAGQMRIPLPLEPIAGLPQPSAWDRLRAEYSTTGISFDAHPLELLRPSLDPEVITTTAATDSAAGEEIRTAGLVTTRQSPLTAKGTVFLLIEDECGALNLIVPRRLADRCRQLIRTARLIEVQGRIERDGRTVSLVVRHLARIELPTPELEGSIPDPNSFEAGR